ncbi:hypothetical protein MRX96_007754 [Rhipicephalus microplus]
MTFAGRVPKGTTNLELAKAFLERFNGNDLKSVKDFGGSTFEVTFRNKVTVDRFFADSVTIKVKGTDIRFEYRGRRAVSVRVYKYSADASDKVLSRALEVYGKVQNISNDNFTSLRITTGNRRARMELRSPVPNITHVDGHVVRCEYDGVVRLCRKSRLPGHERKTWATPWCAWCQQWGASHLRRALKVLRRGSPSTLLQAEAVLGGSHAAQCAAGRGLQPRRARTAAAARERSTSDSSRSESASPECHAATAVVDDDSSSSTTVEDSEMDAGSPAPCDL